MLRLQAEERRKELSHRHPLCAGQHQLQDIQGTRWVSVWSSSLPVCGNIWVFTHNNLIILLFSCRGISSPKLHTGIQPVSTVKDLGFSTERPQQKKPKRSAQGVMYTTDPEGRLLQFSLVNYRSVRSQVLNLSLQREGSA